MKFLFVSFFLSKKCKHGIKGAQCKFKHPSLCKKLLTYGNSEKGCNKGESCTEFHPKMCFNSLKNRECYFDNCRFYHVKGTRRLKYPAERSQHTQKAELDNYVPFMPQNQSFLGRSPINQDLQFLKTEILEAMDMRIATLMSCIQNQPISQGQTPYHVPNPPGFSSQQRASPPCPAPQIPAMESLINPQILPQQPSNQGLNNPMMGQNYHHNTAMMDRSNQF